MNISGLQKIYKTYYLLEAENDKLYPTGQEMSPETQAKVEALERKIAVGKLSLRKVAPELARILSKLTINIVAPEDPNVQTMAVDNFGNIYINPDFSKELTDDEFFGVFAHEALHIANRTFLRKGVRNHTWWNIATDAVMNWALVRDGFALPKAGIIPDPETGVYPIKICKRNFTFTVLGADNEPLAAEEVYAQIDQIAEKLKQEIEEGKLDPKDCGEGEGGGQGQPGQGKPGQGKPGEGPPGKMTPEEAEKIVEEVLKRLDNKTDKHLTDEQARETKSDVEEEISPDKQKELEDDLKKGLKELESSPTYGKGGGTSLRKILKRSLPPDTIDWRGAIKEFLQNANKASYSWATLSRRSIATGVPMPGKAKAPTKLDAIFALDTSGSVGDKQLYVAAEYINKIAKTANNLNVRILLWHSIAYYCSPPLATHGAIKTTLDNIKKHVKTGGNAMSDVDRYINQHGLKPYCVVYITDGQEFEQPKFGNYKKLFVIVSSYLEQTKPAIEKMFRRYGKIIYTPNLD